MKLNAEYDMEFEWEWWNEWNMRMQTCHDKIYAELEWRISTTGQT